MNREFQNDNQIGQAWLVGCVLRSGKDKPSQPGSRQCLARNSGVFFCCLSSVLKVVMAESRGEGLFVSTPEMMSWMTANAHIRRKSPFRGAMSFLVLGGSRETGPR